MYNFLLLIVLFYFVLSCFFCSTIIYFVFPWFMCSPNFLAMFSISIKRCLISISFFPINIKSSAYANTFICSLLIFIKLGTIFILCITFCNAKLNNIGDKVSPCFNPVLFSKKDDSVPSILIALLVFCTHLTSIYLIFLGILNSSIHFHCVSLCSHMTTENQ